MYNVFNFWKETSIAYICPNLSIFLFLLSASYYASIFVASTIWSSYRCTICRSSFNKILLSIKKIIINVTYVFSCCAKSFPVANLRILGLYPLNLLSVKVEQFCKRLIYLLYILFVEGELDTRKRKRKKKEEMYFPNYLT